MTRPDMIRADTIDLQETDHPSAKDHSNQPQHPLPLGSGPAAPHQTSALRHVNDERSAEQDYLADIYGSQHSSQHTSERTSHEGSELMEEDAGVYMENGHENNETQLDEQSIQQNGPDDSETGDGSGEDGLEDDMIDKVSSSPSIDDEDIDFEFVYALHTFVATVEGQANATKGDTMVLLDDSNSYWWLVRVVKDSSIGYLPAEHIETPTERLARLNKHRNIDLSQSMLGDNPEKSKNPIKKAMRRRNAKMVQFTTPTYFEPSEVEYSDTENEQTDADEPAMDNQDGRQEQSQDPQEAQDAIETVNAPDKEPSAEVTDTTQRNESADQVAALPTEISSIPEEGVEPEELAPSVTRNGTIRNTDSFFKDDKAEPRKISLTPNLLREDSNQSSTKSNESKEQQIERELDQIDKQQSPTSDKFPDKKKKDKRPGMLSGIFKKKDKKLKVDEAAGGTVRKEEGLGSPAVVSPDDSTPASPTTAAAPISPTTQQQTSLSKRNVSGGKLTKPPPQNNRLTGQSKSSQEQLQQAPMEPINATTSESALAARRKAGPDEDASSTGPQALSVQIPDSKSPGPSEPQPQEQRKEGGVLSPLTNLLSPSSSDQPKTEKLKKAKHRMELDVDSSPDTEDPGPAPFSKKISQSNGLSSARNVEEDTKGFNGPQMDNNTYQTPTPLMSSSSQNEQSATTDSGRRSADQLTNSEPPSTFSTVTAKEYFSTPTASSTATTPVPETPPTNVEDEQWDDGALRSYLDNESNNEVKDLLLLVQDNTGVVPVSNDHPIMMELGYHKHQKQLDDMSSKLDRMLTDWLSKRSASKQAARSR